MRGGAHYAAADFAQALEYLERALARTDIVHAGDHARRDHGARAQWTTPPRTLRERERERCERAAT